MQDIYLYLVILLFLLAILDLVVGVSNDAVNFLNSAVGSKVAPRHIIMIIASLGILMGATFSSGMMEVARSGIFNPETFSMEEVMVIFLAVMITDVILLDLFNTFGMPTSTTVSIVFELLGAAVAMAVLKLGEAEGSFSSFNEYINSSGAITIISGIFISVGIAFVIGAVVQYISRLLLSFQLNKRMKWVGGVWSGMALAALTYFLLVKGASGASFMSTSTVQWIEQHAPILLLLGFIFWTIVMQICVSVLRWNVLKFVVLFGTFSLAMSFAGNDLVNFIGVPMAGFESFNAWNESGIPATDFMMTDLSEPIRTKPYLLILAGLIMVITLWFSKKARSVTETEVNLARQDEGSERFQSNALARGLVRWSISANSYVGKVIPQSWIDKAESSFDKVEETTDTIDTDPPAFDLVRASVNLTMASVLIAFATSLKLPLSTTYVSFMVAMGTSLSDRAWGRSSAVYRVAGVINVIGGWFFTAIIAFAAAALFATFMHFFGLWGIGILVLLALFMISRTFLYHRKKEQKKEMDRQFTEIGNELSSDGVIVDTSQKIASSLKLIRDTYASSLDGLISENLKQLQNSRKQIKELSSKNELIKQKLFDLIKRIDPEDTDVSRVYLLVYDLEQDIVQSASLITESCSSHVDDSLEPFDEKTIEELESLRYQVVNYLDLIIDILSSHRFDRIDRVIVEKTKVFNLLESYLGQKVDQVKSDDIGMRNSLLFFTIVLETKDLVAVAARFVKLYNRSVN